MYVFVPLNLEAVTILFIFESPREPTYHNEGKVEVSERGPTGFLVAATGKWKHKRSPVVTLGGSVCSAPLY